MKKGWTTTKLITIGSLAVLRLIFSLFSAPLANITGVTGAGGAISFIFSAITWVLVCFIVQEFWSATLLGLVYGFLSIGLPIFGPPGFAPKILLVGMMGLAVDAIYAFLKKNEKICALAIGAISQGILPPIVLSSLTLVRIPGSEAIFMALPLPLMIIGGLFGGATAGFIGYILYKKLENTAVVKRIQG